VESSIREAMETGVVAGYPVIDIKVALHDGSYHEVDSSEIAFKMAGAMALRSGIRKAKPILLEPVMKLEVATPQEFMGDMMGDLNARRGQVEGIETRGDLQIIRCYLPLGEAFGYATNLRSMSQGRATHSMEFHRYQEVPSSLAEEIIARSKGEVLR
jgi:elongation factor G